MTDGKINERILKGIRENSGDDEVLSNCLIELIFKEGEQLGRWKEFYKKTIGKYSEKWGNNDEN